MENIEFFIKGQRSSKIFLSTFFQILAMNVIKYFDLSCMF